LYDNGLIGFILFGFWYNGDTNLSIIGSE